MIDRYLQFSRFYLHKASIVDEDGRVYNFTGMIRMQRNNKYEYQIVRGDEKLWLLKDTICDNYSPYEE